MNKENIEKMLYNYKKLDSWIDDCEKELQQLRDRISVHYAVGISTISDMPHGTGTSDNTYSAVEKIDKLREIYVARCNKLAKDIQQLYKQKELVEYILPRLKPLMQDIVKYRYFQNLVWKDIYTHNENIDQSTWYKANAKLFKDINILLDEKKAGI